MVHHEFDLELEGAAAHLPGNCDLRAKRMRLWRMARKGIKARNGMRIHLEHRRVGGRLMTSAKAIDRFFDLLNSADLEHFSRDGGHTTTVNSLRASAEHAAAAAELDRLGV